MLRKVLPSQAGDNRIIDLNLRLIIYGVIAFAPLSATVMLAGSNLSPSVIFAMLCLSTAGLAAMMFELSPLRDVVRAARVAFLSACAEGVPPGNASGLREIADALVATNERIASLQHRWEQRHRLTDLPTRELLLARMASEIEAGHGEGVLGTLRMAEYDRLNQFDTRIADQIICAFAKRLSRGVGKNRTLAHVDRDCFAIWFGRGVDVCEARAEFEALSYALTKEIGEGSLELLPDVETAITIYPHDGHEAEVLLNRSLALLARPGSEKEKAGKSSISRSSERSRDMFQFEQDLRHALARNELVLHYQPIVDVKQCRITGAEALLRWQHPTRGLVAPGAFIHILEDTGLIDEIGLWVLNTACRECALWQERGASDLFVGVNLSARQLLDSDLSLIVERTLERHGLPASCLELELTETAAAQDLDRTLDQFATLHEMGVRLAIDDFGAGYSSLGYLKKLPFDKLKIDREFVSMIDKDRDNRAICHSLVTLAEGMSITLLAEGVERLEEVRCLQVLGCRIFQGHYFSHPVEADIFWDKASNDKWLAAMLSVQPAVHMEAAA